MPPHPAADRASVYVVEDHWAMSSPDPLVRMGSAVAGSLILTALEIRKR